MTNFASILYGENAGQAPVGDFDENGYNLWFGSEQEAPFYAEIYRATQLNEFYPLEGKWNSSARRGAPRHLSRAVTNEAKKVWRQLLGWRRN